MDIGEQKRENSISNHYTDANQVLHFNQQPELKQIYLPLQQRLDKLEKKYADCVVQGMEKNKLV